MIPSHPIRDASAAPRSCDNCALADECPGNPEAIPCRSWTPPSCGSPLALALMFALGWIAVAVALWLYWRR